MNEEIVYGINPVMEALRGKRRAFELFVTGSSTDKRLTKLLRLAAERGVPVRHREKGDLTRLCGTDFHQGVALRLEPFAYANLDDMIVQWKKTGAPGLVLILDGVQDPHNLGAIIRSAACAGAHGVVIPFDRAVGVTGVVEKSAAGAVETLPIVRVTNLVQAMEALKREGFWIYGAAGEAVASLYEQDLTGNVALVIGSEGEGVRPLVRKKCDFLISIPIRGGVNSLNASVAGGVVLFEAVRQRLARRQSEKGIL